MKKGKSSNVKSSNIRITAVCCQNALYSAADEAAGNVERPRAAGVILIEVPCSGRIDAIFMLKAFDKGADGVVIIACKPDVCTTIEGSARMGRRVVKVRKLLVEAGLEAERLEVVYVDGPSLKKLPGMLSEFTKKIEKMGPSAAR